MKNATKYFESWYMKHTVGDISFVFVISFNVDEESVSYASIQFITKDFSCTKKYPLNVCHSNPEIFDIKIDNNKFSNRGIKVDIDFDGYGIKCDIKYGGFQKIKPYKLVDLNYLDKQKITKQILSIEHGISGYIDFDGTYRVINKGIGTIQKDESSLFQKYYLWTHNNFYHQGQGSIMLSVFDKDKKQGQDFSTLCHIRYMGNDYILSSFRGAKIYKSEKYKTMIGQGKYLVIAELFDNESTFFDTFYRGQTLKKYEESIAVKIRYRFYINHRKIFDFIGSNSSLIYGDFRNNVGLKI